MNSTKKRVTLPVMVIFTGLALFLGVASSPSIARAQSAGAFTAIGNMITARAQHTATQLENGKVLIARGSTERAAELYAPPPEPSPRQAI
jgi:hypothetical protein